MQAELERTLDALVLGPAFDPADPAAVSAFLDSSALDAENREAVRVELPRLLVYRKLVRNRLREAAELAMPRAIARLGPLFDEYFERFLAEHGPRTHYLRDVTSEFLDFCRPLFPLDARIPAYLHDLGRHEALEIVVASGADTRPGELATALDLDAGLCFLEAACVVRYDYAVQRLPDDPHDRSEPLRAETALFVYRSPEHDVRYLELTPLAAAILERLLAGDSLRAALSGASAALSVPLEADVVAGTARLLAELAERGAVLGPSHLNADREGSTMPKARPTEEAP